MTFCAFYSSGLGGFTCELFSVPTREIQITTMWTLIAPTS